MKSFFITLNLLQIVLLLYYPNNVFSQGNFEGRGEIEGVTISQSSSGFLYFFTGMTIDADGSPRAYHPQKEWALDYLDNAGAEGNWWALVTHDLTTAGNLVVQKDGDPYPGYYISMTSLADTKQSEFSTKRYVDSEWIPYIALPNIFLDWGCKPGDLAFVYNHSNGKYQAAIFADVGSNTHIGEGSIYLAERLLIPPSPKNGGTSEGISYYVFPGSGDSKPKTKDEIERMCKQLLDQSHGGFLAFIEHIKEREN